MDKLDLKKQYKGLYKATAKPAMVDVPPLACLMIDGVGDPNHSPQFESSLQALYGLSFTMKFASKKAGGPDWTVMGLEGLWWADDMSSFSQAHKDQWRWTLLIVQPPCVTAEMVTRAAEELCRKKGTEVFRQVRLETLDEGPSAQVLHVGPYSAEGPTIEALHQFIAAAGKRLRGKHHEVYLSDARRVAPDKLKTILRQPIE